jgi:DNA-binding MarR family transcriptional regulator
MFQGSLRELHLPDVIQLVSVSGKTGAFHLYKDNDEGIIFLELGKIVHAVLGSTEGDEAVYAMATWTDGNFRFIPDENPPKHTITKSNTNLLMEAARRLDEWKILSKKIPSLDMIPKFEVPQGKKGKINLNTQEWLILSKVNGQNSIAEIAMQSNLSPFDVAKMLYGLITMGLVQLEQPESSTKTPAEGQKVEQVKPPPNEDPVIKGLKQLLEKLANTSVETLGESASPGIKRTHEQAVKDLLEGKGAEAVQYMCQELLKQANIIKGSEVQKALADRFREVLSSWNAEQG